MFRYVPQLTLLTRLYVFCYLSVFLLLFALIFLKIISSCVASGSRAALAYQLVYGCPSQQRSDPMKHH